MKVIEGLTIVLMGAFVFVMTQKQSDIVAEIKVDRKDMTKQRLEDIASKVASHERIRTAYIDEVIHAAKLAGISSFIESLPQGYDTKVGERGVRLSGGQVQRIGIARALYRKPSVIVFDEATNALDGITEKILIETIHKISHQKTIIMIAHRLTSVKRCDSIHLIENGIISESGSYEQLISKESSFKKMVDSHG